MEEVRINNMVDSSNPGNLYLEENCLHSYRPKLRTASVGIEFYLLDCMFLLLRNGGQFYITNRSTYF